MKLTKSRKIELGSITQEDRMRNGSKYRYRKMQVAEEPEWLAELPDGLWLAAGIFCIAILIAAGMLVWTFFHWITGKDLSALTAPTIYSIIGAAIMGCLTLIARVTNGCAKRKHTSVIIPVALIIFMLVLAVRPYWPMIQEAHLAHDQSGDYEQYRAYQELYGEEVKP